MVDRLGDTARFYELLGRLAHRVGGPRLLRSCRGGMSWPRRGVYFFFENGEPRSGTGAGPRVVRVGAHGLKNGAPKYVVGGGSLNIAAVPGPVSATIEGRSFGCSWVSPWPTGTIFRSRSRGAWPGLPEKLRGG